MLALSSMENRIVLIVDDDASLREVLQEALELEHHLAAVASDGVAALRWLRQHGIPCLILLDLMMPTMNGWEVVDELVKDDRLAQVPIVIITAFGKDLGNAAGLPVLRKPIELDDLLRVVDSYCPPEA